MYRRLFSFLQNIYGVILILTMLISCSDRYAMEHHGRTPYATIFLGINVICWVIWFCWDSTKNDN